MRGSVLSSLSKEIRHESKEAVTKTLSGAYQHSNFKIILPAYADSTNRHHTLGLLEAQLPFGAQHGAKNVDTMHFITAHLGRNAPLAVFVEFRPFGRSRTAVYGASEEITSVVEKEMTSILSAMEKQLKSGDTFATRPIMAAGSRNDEIHISDLDIVVEKVEGCGLC